MSDEKNETQQASPKQGKTMTELEKVQMCKNGLYRLKSFSETVVSMLDDKIVTAQQAADTIRACFVKHFGNKP